MVWVGEAVAVTVFVWLALVGAHAYRLDHPRCPRCRRRHLSALDGHLHDCPFPPRVVPPTRRPAHSRRVGTLAHHRGGTGTWQ